MSATNLRPEDWDHRLHVLWAWRKWRHVSTSDCDEGATYRAVLDGCAVTLRGLCGILGVKCHFGNKTLSDGQNRIQELLDCCTNGDALVRALPKENQRCLLEVLYLGNRAVAHPDDGGLDHKAGPHEMTLAINAVLDWLASKRSQWPALKNVPNEFLDPIREEKGVDPNF
jgi:hypothetical protein